MPKFLPKTKRELQELIKDESIYLGDIDVSNITDMSKLFFEDENEVEIHRLDFSGISSWDVSKVTDMSHMFEDCYVFNENISSWDVSSVKNMERMFDECNFFAQDISSWDVSGCENMSGMFSGCYAFN